MYKDIWLLFLKGIPIGISNVLPGISGGTIAVILRIYDILIEAIKELNFKIILPIGFGAFLGLLSTASLINYLLDTYASFMAAFIFGLIIASVKVTIMEVKKINLLIIIYLIVGFLIAFNLGQPPFDINQTSEVVSTSKLVFSGVFASISMLLPGISGATILVLLGIYEFVIEALLAFNIPIILIFASSAIVGILGLAWVLSYFLKHYRSELMSGLSGLIIGSALVVVPKTLSLVDLGGVFTGIIIVLLLSRSTAN